MNRIILTISIVFALFVPGSLYPHGVDILVIGGGSGVEAKYDSGDPISHADVTIYSPGNEEEPSQTGVTDRNGRFLFYPDMDGVWKVVVNDWTGHGGTKLITIKDSAIVQGPEVEMPIGRKTKILAGISVIFGLTGILFFVLARRERKRSVDAHS